GCSSRGWRAVGPRSRSAKPPPSLRAPEDTVTYKNVWAARTDRIADPNAKRPPHTGPRNLLRHENAMTASSAIQEMLDRESIRNVVWRLCRAMDRADIELFRSCYHEDAWDDHGYYKGPVSEFN